MRKLPKKMWAGVVDGQIYAEDCSDPYTPVAIALFPTRAEAMKHFAKVCEVHAAEMLATGDS